MVLNIRQPKELNIPEVSEFSRTELMDPNMIILAISNPPIVFLIIQLEELLIPVYINLAVEVFSILQPKHPITCEWPICDVMPLIRPNCEVMIKHRKFPVGPVLVILELKELSIEEAPALEIIAPVLFEIDVLVESDIVEDCEDNMLELEVVPVTPLFRVVRP